MPQILILTDSPQRSGEVVYREKVARSCMESEHFSHQLLERVNWAVADADVMEREEKAPEPARLHAVADQPEPEPAWHPVVR
jgi:hypothetical protein